MGPQPDLHLFPCWGGRAAKGRLSCPRKPRKAPAHERWRSHRCWYLASIPPPRSYSQLQITFVTSLLCRGKVETPKQTNECRQSHGVHESKPKLPSPRASTHHGLLSGAVAGRGHGKLTRSVSAGETFASLSHYARVACAHQLCVRSSVGEASIEEVRPWPRAENKAHSPRVCSAPSTVLRRSEHPALPQSTHI